jgi:hypothetical protein
MRTTNHFIKRTFLLILRMLLTCSILYLCVIIPSICLIVSLVNGRYAAEDSRVSLMFLHPVHVLFGEPEKVPSTWWESARNGLDAAGELIAFFATLLSYPCILKIATNGFARFLMLLPVIGGTYALSALVRVNALGGILPFIAALSGIFVARQVIGFKASRLERERGHEGKGVSPHY